MVRKSFALALMLGFFSSTNVTVAADAPLNGVESSVTIYVYPPRHAIDWSTPSHALKSFLGNIIRALLAKNKRVKFNSDFEEEEFLSSNYKSTMGHTIGHVRCALPGGEVYERWSSLSGQDMMAVDKQILLKDKVGLGALFYDYVDGHIISGNGNLMRLTYYRGSKVNDAIIRPRYMQFEVDAEHCAKLKSMVNFFEAFHFPKGTTLAELERRPPESLLYFTNSLDPYDSYQKRLATGHGKVGGGCAPFGAALLKEAGRFRPEFDGHWRTPVSISEKLIGGIKDRETGEIRRVSFLSLLFSRLGKYWNYSDEGYPNRRLSLYDPQLMWDFTGNMMSCLNKSQWCRAQYAKYLGTTRGAVAKGAPRIFRGLAPKELKRRARDSEEAGRILELPEFEEAEEDLEREEELFQPVAAGVPATVEQRVDGFVWRLER